MIFSANVPGTGLALYGLGVGGETLRPPSGAVFLRQVHGARVHEDPEPCLEGDGMVLPRDGGAFPGLRTADCLPLFAVWDHRVGCAHCGWRGLASGILPALLARGGGPPGVVVLGPCVCGDCYRVGEETRREVLRSDPRGAFGHPPGRLDLRLTAIRSFPPGTRVFSLDRCTLCQPGFHSHRRNATLLRNSFWVAPEGPADDIPNLVSLTLNVFPSSERGLP